MGAEVAAKPTRMNADMDLTEKDVADGDRWGRAIENDRRAMRRVGAPPSRRW